MMLSTIAQGVPPDIWSVVLQSIEKGGPFAFGVVFAIGGGLTVYLKIIKPQSVEQRQSAIRTAELNLEAAKEQSKAAAAHQASSEALERAMEINRATAEHMADTAQAAAEVHKRNEKLTRELIAITGKTGDDEG